MVTKWSKLRIKHSRIHKMILTLLENSTIETTLPMHASIMSSPFSSTDYRDAGLIDLIEQSTRSTTPISLNNTLGYVKAFFTLPNSEILPFAVSFDNLECSRIFLVEYLNPDPLFCFLVTVVVIVPSASLICSNSYYDLWASNKMNVTMQDLLAYIWVVCTMVANSPTSIFGCMILEFIKNFCFGVATILSSLSWPKWT